MANRKTLNEAEVWLRARMLDREPIAPPSDFVRESNRIEGITREPLASEIAAHDVLLERPRVTLAAMESFVAIIQPDASLREHEGQNVRVGNHRPIPGGPQVRNQLVALLDSINAGRLTAFEAHVAYETIHPFMDGNGRSGRALWLRMMGGVAPLGFLHTWYYQSLDASRRANNGGTNQ